MKPDHEAAKKWGGEAAAWTGLKAEEGHHFSMSIGNLALCYLDAMAQLEAVRLALGGYKDPDLASLATTLKARLDKATELLREAEPLLVVAYGHMSDASATIKAIRAFLDERK